MQTRFLVWMLFAAVVFAAGCYRKPTYTPPETYPVVGKLVAPAGRIPAGSLLKLIPKEGSYIAEGTIDEDGSFTLKTLFHEEWLAGGVPGEYVRAEVLIPIGLGPLGGQTVTHNKKFVIEPKENNITVTLK
jgi:hypothetical protein